MAVNPCDLFPSEVFVDDVTGEYRGDFAYGDGPGGPFGWVSCMTYTDTPHFFFGCFRYYSLSYMCGEPGSVGMHVPFTFGAGFGSTYTVSDSSGPPGLEAMPAMRVDLPGSADANVGWAGSQVWNPTTGAWSHGILDGSTGWNPASDETWIFQCWAKLVSDPGVPVRLRFDVAPEGFSTGSPTGEDVTLSEDWQFYQTTFMGGFFPSSSFYWPIINFGTVENEQPDFCHFFSEKFDFNTWHPRGSVLIKCAHLYMPTAVETKFWLANFHGHGPVA